MGQLALLCPFPTPHPALNSPPPPPKKKKTPHPPPLPPLHPIPPCRLSVVAEQPLDWPRCTIPLDSIKQMSDTMRYAIEKENKLQDETLLEDKDFIVDLVRAHILLCIVRIKVRPKPSLWARVFRAWVSWDEVVRRILFKSSPVHLRVQGLGGVQAFRITRRCFDPFTPKSDQFQISPVVSPVLLRHTV